MSRKIKIAHSLDQLQDQVILTIKDRPLIANGQIDEDVDILQNDDIQVSNEAKYNSELKTKLKNLADASSSHLEAKNEGNTDILPHYNDYSYKPETIEIEQGSVIRPKKTKKSKALGEDYVSNQSTRLNSQYTSRQAKKSTDTKKTARELLSFLQQTAQDDKVEVKREWQGRDILEESLNQIKKKRVFDGAIKNIVSNQPIAVEDEEQSLLLQSIQRSRRKAERERRSDKGFSVLDSIKQEEQGDNRNQKLVEIEMNPIAYKSSEGIRQAKDVQIKQVVSGTTSAMFVHLPSQRLVRKSEVKQELPQSFNELSEAQLKRMKKEIQFLEEKEVGTGLAGTLQYLRQNDLLGKEEQVGRYNDKELQSDPNDKIKLQYRNASGKLMKPKQAFRYICAKFHGGGPGKNKVQMRKRRELQELRMKEAQNSGGKLLNILEKHQQQSGEAHMVLNIGGKVQSRR